MTEPNSPATRNPRLKRSNCNTRGITRRRHGTGFSYLQPDGKRLRDPEVRERIERLAIPPAWSDVWISPAANGHIQATGADDAGRRQYLYHPHWRELKDREKFDRALDFGDSLRRARPAITRLLHSVGTTEQKAYAAAFRMMDTGALRVGNEEYALTNGSYGVTTLQSQHVGVRGDDVRLDFPAKSGQQWQASIHDPDLAAALRPMLRRGPEEPALGYENDDGGWAAVSSAGLNDFIRDQCGDGFTAKDFRTWQGTVTAALALVQHPPVRPSVTARKKAVTAAIREVAEYLSNTPTVARKSYVDPRVLDRFMQGETIDAGTYRAAERAVRRLIG